MGSRVDSEYFMYSHGPNTDVDASPVRTCLFNSKLPSARGNYESIDCFFEFHELVWLDTKDGCYIGSGLDIDVSISFGATTLQEGCLDIAVE